MKNTAIAVLTLLVLLLTSEAQSIKPKSLYAKKSTFEIGGDVFFTLTSHSVEQTTVTQYNYKVTITTISVNAGAGFFVIDGLKLGIEPVIEYQNYDGDNSWTRLKLYFTPEYVFDSKSIIYPYIGGSAGYTSTSSSSSMGNSSNTGGFSWGFKSGMKINALGNTLFNFGAKYYRETYDYNNSSGKVYQHDNVFGMSAGISVYFR